jgi:hypothetical protein
MTIYPASELPADAQGIWCRQSRLAGVVRYIVFGGVLAVPIVCGWHFQRSWLIWLGAAAAIILLPLLLLDVAKMFRATNWVLLVGPDGLWLNLRSYGDHVATEGSIVRIEYGEIDTVGRHARRYFTPSKENIGPGSQGGIGGTTAWKDQFLEIRLNHEQTDELKTALNNLRSPRAGEQPSSNKLQIRSGYPYTTWLVSPSVLRVIWSSGHGPLIRPSLKRTLSELATHVKIAAPTELRRSEWRRLSPEEIAELTRELIHVHGAEFEATAVLVRAGGVAYADAKALIGQVKAEVLDFPRKAMAKGERND